ncbi:LysE family translocator [Quadrisphaera sp. INWT6]|uniref:LysE family translocator n=1 Tax=Quadrisphaera sp. INWT6 TaxID=2596917 RepID=UPI0018921942|nr:LysE family translocator [Quadrisphaera sp. INWT6]MBF5083436.1 LysE family translocator [Quadrisphaera sp. INWT6]
MPDQLLPFLVVVAVLTLTPGPDMALVLRNGVRGGSSAAWWTGLGCCTGIAGYAAASAVGLAALLAASATAFTALKLVGAAYLVYLGVMALWHSRRRPAAPAAGAAGAAGAASAAGAAAARAADREAGDPGVDASALRRATAFRQGLLSNLLNPKIALLFLTLIPQFVTPGEPVWTTGVLAAVFLAVAVVWWRAFSLAVGALGALLSRERVRTAVDRVAGVVLIGLGVRVALSHR